MYGSVVAVTSLAVLASNAVVPWPDWMSIARALGSGALVAYLLSIVVDRWLWRIQPFKALFGVPDFGGRWEGWYWNTLGKQWLPNALEASQRLSHVSYHSWGPKNESTTVWAELMTDGSTKIELTAVYRTKAVSGQAKPHWGAANLSFSRMGDQSLLTGTYWTDSVRDDGTKGHYGYIRLARARKGKGNLDGWGFTENDWAMPEPAEPPETTTVPGASPAAPAKNAA